MSLVSTYQPFLIGEGQSKTGLFTYLQSWVKPGDAFDLLENAFVFRGTIQKRKGMGLYPSTAGAGSLVYANSSKVGSNAAGGVVTISNGGGNVVIPVRPIVSGQPGSVIFYANSSAGVRKWTDDGAGNLVGAGGDSGTVNYTTGAWTITLAGGRTFTNPTDIWAVYSFAAKYVTTGGPFANPIMGIKTYINETNNSQQLVVMDTRRLSWYNSGVSSFQAVDNVKYQAFKGTVAAMTIVYTIPFGKVTPFTLTVFDGTDTIHDLGNGTMTTAGNMAGPNTIVYATGVLTLNLTAGSTATYTITYTMQGDYFTGDNTNFFNAENWNPTDDQQGGLYLTNNKDHITIFNNISGPIVFQPPFCVTTAQLATYQQGVKTCLDLKVYKGSMLLIRTTLEGATVPEPQTIRSSIPETSEFFDPHDYAADIVGHGQSTVAPTGDWIMATQFLRDALVVFMYNSTWLFRYTGSTNDSYRYDKINNTKTTNAPYGSIAYDEYCTSMGNRGFIFCDGNNVDRYDIDIIDQYLDIQTPAFGQCFGQRFDILQQSWMLFPNIGDGGGPNEETISTRALIYNFLEKTWATFVPVLGAGNGLSCLGIGATTTDLTWGSFALGSGQPMAGYKWEQWEEAWNSYLDTSGQPALLGGDQLGFVYELNVGVNDNGNLYISDIVTKKFNPFITGEKGRFGYVDVYYEQAAFVDLEFLFYVNNSENAYLTRTISLTTNNNEPFGWQRIYLNGVVGEFLQMEIIDNGNAPFTILGMILYAAPAGRLTPGSFL